MGIGPCSGAWRPLQRVEVVEAGFYRNRGAYILGAVEVVGETGPMALALLHREDGVEAKLTHRCAVRTLFTPIESL